MFWSVVLASSLKSKTVGVVTPTTTAVSPAEDVWLQPEGRTSAT